MDRQQQLAHPAADAILADLHEGSHGWSTHVIEFFAIGTAVVPIEGGSHAESIPDPQLVLSVNS